VCWLACLLSSFRIRDAYAARSDGRLAESRARPTQTTASGSSHRRPRAAARAFWRRCRSGPMEAEVGWTWTPVALV
jgi:hypothetical protein